MTAPDPLGVPGYAGAKGAVPEPRYWAGDGPPSGPGISEPPEPQGPTTLAGRQLDLALASAEGLLPYDYARKYRAVILAIEAEARAAASPDIDALREVLARILRIVDTTEVTDLTLMPRLAEAGLFDAFDDARALLTASPDATRREPNGE